MKHIYLLFFLCLLCSCKESEKEKIARLVREWDGKEISFPFLPIQFSPFKGKTRLIFLSQMLSIR